jgi:hypothetical protein
VLFRYIMLYSFFLLVLSITEIKALKSPNVIMEFSIYPFNSATFCFIYYKVLVLDTYTFRVIMFP